MEVTKGILAILAASLLYGVMPVIVKELLNEGMTGECIVAWRFGTAFVICAAVAWRKKISSEYLSGRPPRPQWPGL